MGRDVHVDWALSVITATLIAVFLVAMGFKEKALFVENLKNGSITPTTKDSSNIDTKSLDAVLNRYKEKVLIKEDVIRSYKAPADPSF